jgi:hypothetical protein
VLKDLLVDTIALLSVLWLCTPFFESLFKRHQNPTSLEAARTRPSLSGQMFKILIGIALFYLLTIVGSFVIR